MSSESIIFVQPRMVSHLFDVDAFVHVSLEHSSNQIQTGFGIRQEWHSQRVIENLV